MLRISLRRSRADWPIVVAAGLICLLAATLLAAGSIYANAVSIAGLHRVLADPAGRSREHRGLDPRRAGRGRRGRRHRGGGADWRLRRGRRRGPPIGEVRLLRRARPAAGRGRDADRAWLCRRPGRARDRSSRARGRRRRPSRPVATFPSRSAETVAAGLGLQLGDASSSPARSRTASSCLSRSSESSGSTIRRDPFWWDEPARARGCPEQRRFDTHGPLFTTREALLSRATPTRIELTWHGRPDVGPHARRGRRGAPGRVSQLPGRAPGRPRQHRHGRYRAPADPRAGRALVAGQPHRRPPAHDPARRPGRVRRAAQRGASDRAPTDRHRDAPVAWRGDLADRRPGTDRGPAAHRSCGRGRTVAGGGGSQRCSTSPARSPTSV